MVWYNLPGTSGWLYYSKFKTLQYGSQSLVFWKITKENNSHKKGASHRKMSNVG